MTTRDGASHPPIRMQERRQGRESQWTGERWRGQHLGVNAVPPPASSGSAARKWLVLGPRCSVSTITGATLKGTAGALRKGVVF